jgi:hypothetical protein
MSAGLPYAQRRMWPACSRMGGHPLGRFEQGEIGLDLLRHACLMGLEGMGFKHRAPGRQPHWVKVKTGNIRQWAAISLV